MSELDLDTLDQVEARLAAAPRAGEAGGGDTRPIMDRARRELAVRDLMLFGFAHALQTLLALVSGVGRSRKPGSADDR